MMIVSVYQGESLIGDIESNIKTVKTSCTKAASQKADLIVFPELFLCGYVPKAQDLISGSITNVELLKLIGPIAITNRINIALPYSEMTHVGLFNSVLIVGNDGSLIHNYRKINLWGDYENKHFQKGNILKSFLLKTRNNTLIPTGVVICYDIEFPEPARCLALQGAKLLIVPTALAQGPLEKVTPTLVVPTRACENQIFIAYSNLVGPGDLCQFCGQSAIVSPAGVDIERADDRNEKLLTAKLDFEKYQYLVKRNPYLEELTRRAQEGVYCSLTQLSHGSKL